MDRLHTLRLGIHEFLPVDACYQAAEQEWFAASFGGSLDKIPQYPHAKPMAFFGMKLNAIDILAPHRASHRSVKLIGGGHIVVVVTLHPIAVREVESMLVVASEQLGPWPSLYIGPTHERHLDL